MSRQLDRAAHDDVRAAAAPNWRYEFISDDVLPALREAGVTDRQIDQMLVDNPRQYFSGIRPCSPRPTRPVCPGGPDGIKALRRAAARVLPHRQVR